MRNYFNFKTILLSTLNLISLTPLTLAAFFEKSAPAIKINVIDPNKTPIWIPITITLIVAIILGLIISFLIKKKTLK